MYLFPALTCEPVIGSLEAFTKGILRVFEAVLTEPETEINTGRLAPEASAVCLTSKTITPSLGNLHHTLGQIPNTTFSVDSPICYVFQILNLCPFDWQRTLFLQPSNEDLLYHPHSPYPLQRSEHVPHQSEGH